MCVEPENTRLLMRILIVVSANATKNGKRKSTHMNVRPSQRLYDCFSIQKRNFVTTGIKTLVKIKPSRKIPITKNFTSPGFWILQNSLFVNLQMLTNHLRVSLEKALEQYGRNPSLEQTSSKQTLPGSKCLQEMYERSSNKHE